MSSLAMHPTLAAIVAGALFDFAGRLTTLDESIEVGSEHEAPLVLEQLQAWAAERGLSLDDPLVKDWQELLPSAENLEDPDRYRGLYPKFRVERVNPESQARHQDCNYFVLDLDCDPHAIPAVEAYAESCVHEFPRLARDLRLRASISKVELDSGRERG